MRRHRASDVWLTPPPILEALGPFDLDPCAAVGQPWPTAAAQFTLDDDGLTRRWFGRVWLNPPFSHPAPWMARLADHGRGTAIVPTATETAYFFGSVWERAHGLLFLRGRVQFYRVDGVKPEGRQRSRAAMVLVAYGRNDAERLADSSLDGHYVPLALPASVTVMLPAESVTWRQLLIAVARKQGGRLDLARAYDAVEGHPKAAANPHWRDKVRQVLQRAPFERVDTAAYRLAA